MGHRPVVRDDRFPDSDVPESGGKSREEQLFLEISSKFLMFHEKVDSNSIWKWSDAFCQRSGAAQVIAWSVQRFYGLGFRAGSCYINVFC